MLATDFGLLTPFKSLPLFVGMSDDELTHIITTTKLHFHKVNKGRSFAHEGAKNGALCLLINGTTLVQTEADDHGYAISEWLNAPRMVDVESTFGAAQRFVRTYKAHTDCSFITVGKDELLRLVDESLIFRLNLINHLSSLLQHARRQAWRVTAPTLEERIARFIIGRCIRPAGSKIVSIKMERLAHELGVKRREISAALHQLEDQGKLRSCRGRIEIDAAEKLI